MGYTRHTREVQIRLVADFGCWLAKRRIQAHDITAELFRRYLRTRARRRRPTRNDLSALQRLLTLLRRKGVLAAPVPLATTPAEQLRNEFRLYLGQERALASATQVNYTAFVSEFLVERFGAGPVNLSRLSAADITRFVRRRAATIQSKRVLLMTTALRSFLRFARYRGDIDKDLAACIPAVANWKQPTLPRALPPDQVEPAADLMYVGAGNGGPWDGDYRNPGGGGNLYLSCILTIRLNPISLSGITGPHRTTPEIIRRPSRSHYSI